MSVPSSSSVRAVSELPPRLPRTGTSSLGGPFSGTAMSKCQSPLPMRCSSLSMSVTYRLKYPMLMLSLRFVPLVLCCPFVPVSSKISRPWPMVPVFSVCPLLILCRLRYMSLRVLFVFGTLVNLRFALCAVNPVTCLVIAGTRACA